MVSRLLVQAPSPWPASIANLSCSLSRDASFKSYSFLKVAAGRCGQNLADEL